MFTRDEESLLQECEVGRVCTHDTDGYPHCTPVDYIYQKGRILLGTGPGTRKVRNILSNPRVAFEVDVYGQEREGFDWRGIMIKGTATLLKDPREIDEVLARLLKKYPDDAFDHSNAFIAIEPEKKISWGPWEVFRER